MVAVQGRVSVVRQPGNGLYHGWGLWDYFDIAEERRDFWEKFGTSNIIKRFSKEYELFVLPEHDLQRGFRPR